MRQKKFVTFGIHESHVDEGLRELEEIVGSQPFTEDIFTFSNMGILPLDPYRYINDKVEFHAFTYEVHDEGSPKEVRGRYIAMVEDMDHIDCIAAHTVSLTDTPVGYAMVRHVPKDKQHWT